MLKFLSQFLPKAFSNCLLSNLNRITSSLTGRLYILASTFESDTFDNSLLTGLVLKVIPFGAVGWEFRVLFECALCKFCVDLLDGWFRRIKLLDFFDWLCVCDGGTRLGNFL